MTVEGESQASGSEQTLRTKVSARLLHDLRTPLNQIIGYSEMLAESPPDAEVSAVAADLDRIRGAGQRLLSLLEQNFSATGEQIEQLQSSTADDIESDDATAPALSTETRGVLLVVDDDAANRDVLSRRLMRQGHSVRTASSGPEAISAMRDEEFDVVLLDIMMPDMDGYEVLRRIKADPRLQHLPVIMISALSDVRSVVRCIDAGADDYLAKPFNATLLRARIGASLERKRGRDRELVLLEQVQQNYKRLQEVEKLRDDMRNMIVHDLRTPLTSVIAGIEMLETDGSLTAMQRELVSLSLGGGRTLLAMINDLLDVEKMESRPSHLQYQDLSPDLLVAAAVAQVTQLAREAGIELECVIQPSLPLFRGDPGTLTRTLVNLVGNAVKFTRKGSVTITAALEGESMLFSVRDTGLGIPEASFGQIFEKFGQVEGQNRVGTGLGLAFCKLAVEAHGGTIAVESTHGVGSTFSFRIPLVNA